MVEAAAQQQSGGNVSIEHKQGSQKGVRIVGAERGGGTPPSDLAKKRAVQERVRIKAWSVL